MIDNEYFAFYDGVMLRAPYFSFKQYDLARLQDVLLQPDFKNALWLASAAFYSILESKEFDIIRLSAKEQFTLRKYYNRMSFRATPFGAFSSFSLVKWDSSGVTRFDPEKKATLQVLPSRRWQADFGRSIKSGSNGPDLMFIANRTIYRIGSIFRYVKTDQGPDDKLIFSVNELEAEDLNAEIIKAAETPLYFSKIVTLIEKLSGCAPSEAWEYASFLSREQILISELEGSLFEKTDKIKYSKFAGKHITELRNFWDRVRYIHFPPVKSLPDEFTELKQLSEFYDFQVTDDHFYGALNRKAFSGGVSPDTRQQIVQAIALIRRLVIPYPTPFLKEFKEAFKKRFENEKVPLLKAIDPDTGVGYGHLHQSRQSDGLLDDILFSNIAKGPRQVDWTPVHKLLMKIWINNSGRREFDPVEIATSDIDFEISLPKTYQLPQTLALMFTLNNGNIVLENAGGASATALIGRFSVFDPQIEALCRDIAAFESEQNPDVEFAEIHQLSDEHTDNINRRMPVYNSVITTNTFLYNTGQSHIDPSDLLIWMYGDQLLLESLSSGKRIIPRLPTAYNFQHNELALFQILCDLQFEGLQANLTFDPERFFPELTFYPRFFFGKVVLSLAKWKLNNSEVDSLVATPRSIGKLHLFRQERGIPSKVTLGLSDRQLVFDLGNDAEASFFLDCLKETRPAIIREYIPPDDSVRFGKEALAGQFLTVLRRPGKIYPPTPITFSLLAETTVPRSFIPGQDWLYLKIYCSETASDLVLSTAVKPLLIDCKPKIRCWFFIRYKDPNPHLRVRIRGSFRETSKIAGQFAKILSSLQKEGVLSAVSYDTYQRELERYSPELIELVETYFQAGSEWTVGQVNKIGKNKFLPFALVYRLAKSFLKRDFLLFFKRRSESFLREFGGEKQLKINFDQKYRQYRKYISLAIEIEEIPGSPSDDKLFRQIEILSKKSSSWTEERREILLGDLLHMQVNRMFISAQRNHEALLFYCLFKYESGKVKQSKKLSLPADSLTD